MCETTKYGVAIDCCYSAYCDCKKIENKLSSKRNKNRIQKQKKNKKNLPLNLVALVPSTDANFAIDSLVFRSSCVRDAMANFVSMLYVQHVPVNGMPQCLKTASVIWRKKRRKQMSN